MRILIEIEIFEEGVDADHSSGITNDYYEKIVSALSPYGEDISIGKADE